MQNYKGDLLTDRHLFGNKLAQSFWTAKGKELKFTSKIIDYYAAPVNYYS